MNGCLKFFAFVFFALFFYYLIQDEPRIETQIEANEAPKPDTNREIDHFDWEAYKYIYKDEVPVKRLVPDLTGRGEPIPFYPDAAVIIVNPHNNYPSTKPRYVIMNGKRYKILYQADGSQKLIETR